MQCRRFRQGWDKCPGRVHCNGLYHCNQPRSFPCWITIVRLHNGCCPRSALGDERIGVIVNEVVMVDRCCLGGSEVESWWIKGELKGVIGVVGYVVADNGDVVR